MERWAYREIEVRPRHDARWLPWPPAKGLFRSRARPRFEKASLRSQQAPGGGANTAKTEPEQEVKRLGLDLAPVKTSVTAGATER
jgi:hypothetical protein